MEAAATAPVWESQLEQRMGMDEWEMAEFRMELASKAAIGMKKHGQFTCRLPPCKRCVPARRFKDAHALANHLCGKHRDFVTSLFSS